MLNFIMNECDPFISDYFDLKAADKLMTQNGGGPLVMYLADKERGFKHNLHSLRVVMELESPDDEIEYKGLNLTNYTLFGIRQHSKQKWSDCKSECSSICNLYPRIKECNNLAKLSVGYYDKYNKYIINEENLEYCWSFEAFVVAWADEIAQRHHDMEDAIEGKLISHEKALEIMSCNFRQFFDIDDRRNFDELVKKANSEVFLQKLSKFLVNFLVTHLIEISLTNLKYFAETHSLKTLKDFEKVYLSLNLEDVNNLIGYINIKSNNCGLYNSHDSFQNDLKNLVLNSHYVHKMDGKAQYIIRKLFKAYITNPQQLPDKVIISLFREFHYPQKMPYNEISKLRNDLERIKKFNFASDLSEIEIVVNFRNSLLRTICDFIASMTDSYAIKEYESLYN